MKNELIALTKENSENIAKFFSALNPLDMEKANKEIEKNVSLSSFFNSKKDELIAGLEKNAIDNIFSVSRENSYLIKMPFFRQFLTPIHNAHFLRVGLIKKIYLITKLASEKEWAKTIHPDLFYDEVNRLEVDDKNNTIDKKYLNWYENLISHLPEEKKMKCYIGLLSVSISQYYRASLSQVSQNIGFEYQEVNHMPVSKRMEIITILKDKVHFENWSEEMKRQLNGWFKNVSRNLDLHQLAKDIDEWVENLNVVVLHTKLENKLDEKLPEVKKPKI